jgi:hypothetical protein
MKTEILKGYPHIPSDAELESFLFFMGRSGLRALSCYG